MSAKFQLKLLIAALATQAQASLDFLNNPFYQTLAARNAQTNNVQASNESFGDCSCNLTPNGCDPGCCCDPDCSPSTISAWTIAKQCVLEPHQQELVFLKECADQNKEPGLKDLQNGLWVYERNVKSVFCPKGVSVENVKGNFIDMIDLADTAEKFARLKESESQQTFTFLEPPVNDSRHVNSAKGYQPLEYLEGFRGQESDSKFKTKGRIGFTRPSMFGHCSQDYSLKFMEDLETAECVVTKAKLDAGQCADLSFKSQGYFEIRVDDKETGEKTTIKPRIGKQMKFSLDTFLELDAPAGDFPNAVPTGTCGCNNFVLETHYKVLFSKTEVANSYTVDDLVVDVVYGQINGDTCAPRVLSQKTSVKFVESESARHYSGSPGYIKGKPILFARTEQKTKETESGNQSLYTELTYNLNGFPLRGADNKGRCYSVNTPLKMEQLATLDSINDRVTNSLIDTVDTPAYFDDPVLTFEDSMLYGCTVELTKAELEKFCENREWLYLMLFQNTFQLKKFGLFGNANPEFLKDWGDVKIAKDDLFETTAAEGSKECDLPSARVIEIFYSKIGTFEEPQYTIMHVQHYSAKKNPWKFTQTRDDQKQKFSATLSVQFYEVDQEIKSFTPIQKIPDSLQPARNVLYPFKVYNN